MLKAISMQRAIFTLLYRGYDIEVSRAPSGWRVGVYPRTADLPILRCGEAYACVFLPSDGSWDITLGYKDEEEYLPVCTNRESLKDWAALVQWLAEQPWPKWNAPRC